MAYVKTRLSPEAFGMLLEVDTGPAAIYCLLADLGAGLKRGWAGSVSVLVAEISERTGRAPSWHAVDRSLLKLRALGLLDVERQHRNLIVYWLRGDAEGGVSSDRTFARSRETTQRSRETARHSRETATPLRSQRGRGRGSCKIPLPLSCREERPASREGGEPLGETPPPAPSDSDPDLYDDRPAPRPKLSPEHEALAEHLRNGDAPAKAPPVLEGEALAEAKAKAKGRGSSKKKAKRPRRKRGRRR